MGAERSLTSALVFVAADVARIAVMMQRPYDALVLDLDGTLLDGESRVPDRTRRVLAAAVAAGVRVMIATGRSSISAHPILEDLALDTPAIVFNGAALYCPQRRRMLEERVLSNVTLERTLAYGRAHDWLTVVMCADRKFALAPRDEDERAALSLMTALEIVPAERLLVEFAIRVTFFSARHASSVAFAREIEEAVDRPLYTTHFPLSVLASHRASPLQVADVHPPCRGKAEALRVLQETYGIEPERVVAVGDATNDIPMFEAAGLSVAMGNGMLEARAAAQRIIGGHTTDALADLVEELFLAPCALERERA